MDDQKLNLVHTGEQLGEAAAQIAEVVGRYWESLPIEMSDELKNSLTEMYASRINTSIFGDPLGKMFEVITGADDEND
jgi:hypothetical protein